MGRGPTSGAGPSRRLSALLIVLGVVGGIVWMALPWRGGTPASPADVVAEAEGEEAVARLLALGEPAFADLLHASARGAFPGGEPLDPAAREVVADALERADARALVRHLERRGPALDDDLRAAALDLIGARGAAGDVAALLAVARGHTPRSPLEDGVDDALSALIAREPDALDRLRGALHHEPDPVVREAVRAIGGAGRARGVGLLVDLLGRERELDAALMAELGRLGAVASPEDAAYAARRIEPYLDADAPGLARAAANALGRLGDPAPTPDLVDLLASEDEGLARTAHDALKRLTGLRLRGAAGPWRAWYDEQAAWAERRLAATLDDLASDEPAVVLEALREVLIHPLERHVIAREVAAVLERPEVELRRAAADALGRLGSRVAVDALVAALEDPDAAVAEAARRALSDLLGEDHGAAPEGWKAAQAARR